MDEELAELTIDLKPDGPPTRPVSEMTAEVQLLTEAVGLLRGILQQRERKKIQFPPLAVPKTARQLVEQRRREHHRGRLLLRVAEAQARWEAQNPSVAGDS